MTLLEQNKPLEVRLTSDNRIELSHEEGRSVTVSHIVLKMIAAFVFKASVGEKIHLSTDGQITPIAVVCTQVGGISIIDLKSGFQEACPRTLRQWLFELLNEACHDETLTLAMRTNRIEKRARAYATVKGE